MAPTYAPSHARCVISYTPIPSWTSSKMSQHSRHQQTVSILVPGGPTVLMNKYHYLNISSYFLFQTFRQGGNAWNLLDFDKQSAAIFCADTLKYYSTPRDPSRLEGVKTLPELRLGGSTYGPVSQNTLIRTLSLQHKLLNQTPF